MNYHFAKHIRRILGLLAVSIYFFITGCATEVHGIRKEVTSIQFVKSDFEISNQLTAEATEIRVFGIDFSHLFKKSMGVFDEEGFAAAVNVSYPIPIVSSFIVEPKKVQKYALYNLLKFQTGYDIVIYPRFETKSSGIPFIYRKTTAKVTARLGRLKS